MHKIVISNTSPIFYLHRVGAWGHRACLKTTFLIQSRHSREETVSQCHSEVTAEESRFQTL